MDCCCVTQRGRTCSDVLFNFSLFLPAALLLVRLSKVAALDVPPVASGAQEAYGTIN